MDIAWFHSHLLHLNSGGTRFVFETCYGLKQTYHHNVTIYCDTASEESRQYANELGIGLVELDTSSTNSLAFWLKLPFVLKRKRRRLLGLLPKGCVIVNSMFPMNVLVANLPFPRVQMCYEPFAFFYDKGFLRNFGPHHRVFFALMKLLYSRVDKNAVQQMDMLLTVNETNIGKFENVYGRTPVVHYPGIDTHKYKKAAQKEISTFRKLKTGSPLIFHSTDLTGIKGSYYLLEVIKKLREKYPQIKLLFSIYVNDPAGIEKFLQRIKELDLESNVEYLGCLPKDELPLYYSAVDYVCQPSINQPSSWPLKEALLCETPIIAGVESEEVREFKNGCRVDIKSINKSANTIEQLINSKESLDLSKFGSDFMQSYSIDNSLPKLNALVERVQETDFAP